MLFEIYLLNVYVLYVYLCATLFLLGEEISSTKQNGRTKGQRKACDGEYWGKTSGHDTEVGREIS